MQLRIKELDALRGIAALFVVFFHYSMGKSEANLGFKLGVTGVDLFFIISGFVIFLSIQKKSSGLEFVVNRFTRLYPTYWACATITFICQLYVHSNIHIENKVSVVQYLINLTMFQHYFMVRDIDGPYWTMIIEMLFYIFILILFITKKLKFILHIGLCLTIIIGIYGVFLDTIYPYLNDEFIYWFHLFTHFPLFLAGIIFFKIINQDGKWYVNYLLLILCLFVQSYLYGDVPKISMFISSYEYTSMLVLYFLLFILFLNHKLKFIVSKPTLFIGKISFALYLIHQFISIEFIIPGLEKYITTNFWITSSIATFITYYVEIPIGKKMNRSLRLKFKLPVNHP